VKRKRGRTDLTNLGESNNRPFKQS